MKVFNKKLYIEAKIWDLKYIEMTKSISYRDINLEVQFNGTFLIIWKSLSKISLNNTYLNGLMYTSSVFILNESKLMFVQKENSD